MTKAIVVLALAGLVIALTGMGSALAEAPITVPLFEEFEDLNPCSGEVIILTFTGTARISEFDGHFILVARGSVVTSDGFSGTFNRQFVFQDDRVTVLRFHDVEVSDETGQMIVFGVGLIVEITANGEAVVSLLHIVFPRCVR
ncbi:MAG: hypothetical protein ACT4OI_03445 [Methanobacteriota archaeon]